MEYVKQLSKVVPPEGVKLFRGWVLISTMSSWLAEAHCNLVKGATPGLWHLEVGEDKKAQEQDGEDDEDVGATQLLQGKHSFF